jgi:hypothetical protein
VGVICACLPILLVLFKKVVQSGSYIRVVRYLRSISTTRTGSDGVKKKSVSYRIKQKIPKPVITGLRSFMDRHGKNEASSSTGDDEKYDTLDSFDEDYHTQLRNGRSGV